MCDADCPVGAEGWLRLRDAGGVRWWIHTEPLAPSEANVWKKPEIARGGAALRLSLVVVRCWGGAGRRLGCESEGEGYMSHIDAAPRTLARLPLFAAEQQGGRRAVLVKRNGGWQERSYAEVSEEIERLASGFVGYGIQPDERVCILADTRPEIKVFEAGKADPAAIETALQQFRKNFTLNSIQVAAQ